MSQTSAVTDVAARTGGAEPDTGAFRQLLAYIRPRPDEVKWQEIPWQTDLWEARRLAAQQGMPIFLWAMNGNPLGCT
jgi:hypothetical protein